MFCFLAVQFVGVGIYVLFEGACCLGEGLSSAGHHIGTKVLYV